MSWSGVRLDLLPDLVEAVLGIGEEDQSEDRSSVLVSGERRVGPKLVSGRP